MPKQSSLPHLHLRLMPTTATPSTSPAPHTKPFGSPSPKSPQHARSSVFTHAAHISTAPTSQLYLSCTTALPPLPPLRSRRALSSATPSTSPSTYIIRTPRINKGHRSSHPAPSPSTAPSTRTSTSCSPPTAPRSRRTTCRWTRRRRKLRVRNLYAALAWQSGRILRFP